MIDKNASNKQVTMTRRNSASRYHSSSGASETSTMINRLPPAFHVNKKKDKISIKKNATARL